MGSYIWRWLYSKKYLQKILYLKFDYYYINNEGNGVDCEHHIQLPFFPLIEEKFLLSLNFHKKTYLKNVLHSKHYRIMQIDQGEEFYNIYYTLHLNEIAAILALFQTYFLF